MQRGSDPIGDFLACRFLRLPGIHRFAKGRPVNVVILLATENEQIWSRFEDAYVSFDGDRILPDATICLQLSLENQRNQSLGNRALVVTAWHLGSARTPQACEWREQNQLDESGSSKHKSTSKKPLDSCGFCGESLTSGCEGAN